MKSDLNFLNFIFKYCKTESDKSVEKYTLLSTLSSAKIISMVMMALEVGFMIVTVVSPSIYGKYISFYRASYSIFIVNCLSIFFFSIWVKKDIDNRIDTMKIINSIGTLIFMLWAIAISFMDQLNGYPTSPIIFMTISICIVAGIYITPLVFITINLFCNCLYILVMINGMRLGTVALGELTNYCIYAFTSIIVSLSFIYNRFRYYSRVSEHVSDKVKAKQTEELLEQTTRALALTIDAKDKYTKGHSIRVAKYSLMIAERLNLEESLRKQIYYMGLLHDVGKIGVPGDIINKPSSLTDEEYDLIKKHPKIGKEILGTITAMPSLSCGALYHHERFDGKGYPTGISGEAIPLEARIICVADSYDAMTSKRNYRDVMPQEKVRMEIENGKGTQFDPKIADVMLQLIDEDKEYRYRDF